MRTVLMVVCTALVAVAAVVAAPSVIQDRLMVELDNAAPGDALPVVFLLSPEPEAAELAPYVAHLPKQERRDLLWDMLSDRAAKAQADLLDRLHAAEQRGEAEGIRPLVISNGVYARVQADLLDDLARADNIRRVILSEYEQVVERGSNEPVIDELDEIASGINVVNAPAVWDAGYTGEGVIVAVMDTGCDYNHPDLADHLWDGGAEYPNHGYDFESNDMNPMDGYGHGTHCAGTVLGDGTNGSQTGVAPNATLMVLKVLSDWGGGEPYMMWDAMDFALEHNADVTSVSLGWTSAANDVRSTFRTNYDILNLAGIFNSVAAGNEAGSEGSTENLRTPGNVPGPWIHPDQTEAGGVSGVHTAGATDDNDNLAYFSSIGPVTWENVNPFNDFIWNNGQNQGCIKPDLSAPGVDVLSTVIGGGYSDSYSGTSMATPHIAGAAALLFSMSDIYEPADIAEILQMTSVDLGTEGKDNFYGAGRLDCFEAMLMGETYLGPVVVRLTPEYEPWYFDQNGGTMWFDAEILSNVETPTPGQAWTEVILPNGNVYPLNTYNIMIQPDVDIVVNNVTQAVPAGAPEGVYQYVLKVGQYPNNVIGQDSFEFVKMTLSPNGDTEWVPAEGLDALEQTASDDAGAVVELPGDFELGAAWPNPFNPTTSINVFLPERAPLHVTVYDVNGRQVAKLANGARAAGSHTLTLDGRALSSGVYFVQATVPGKLNATRKVMLVK